MKPIIQVQNISKKYELRGSGARSIRELFSCFSENKTKNHSLQSNPINRLKAEPHKFIWALKDISFSVLPGEIVGVIGKNGCGKSTLLKILSRITLPTSGEAIIWGKVLPLLGIGTGFDPELSGLENIFLNGAILGMRRKEIQKKLEAIINFSGVETFIDSPVKHYSSGMSVRLAFSVAAHLEQPILFIDEVLAVGDRNFQEKSLQKMKELAQNGRTVLFVSHSSSAVKSLCTRCIYLKAGKIVKLGPTADIIDLYQSDTSFEVAA